MELFAGAAIVFGIGAVAYLVPWGLFGCFKLTRRALRRRPIVARTQWCKK